MSQPIHGSNEPLGPEVDGMDHSDSMNATGKKAGEKKRVSRAGTRSVSTLSPAQLARKRANDREAQRNIRLRTKEHIERLEARIEELTCGRESGAELEEARKRNEALEREVRQLSESLAQLRDDDSSSPDRSSMLDLGQTAIMPGSSARDVRPGMASTSMSFGPMDMAAPISGPASTSALDETNRFSYFDPIPAVNFNDVGNWAPRSVPSGVVQDSRLTTPQPRPLVPQSLTSPVRQTIPPSLQPFQSLQPWALPILNTSTPTCGVDTYLMNIINGQKELASQGAPEAQIIGPSQPSMKALIYPDDPNQTHVVSTIISNLLTNLAVKGLAERAGCLYLMYHICQWQIYPSSSTYGNLTDWTSPRTSQLITPHPLWADSIFWGKLKDRVIEKQDVYANEDFQNAYILCINANWPRPDLEAFRFEGDDIFITEEFENHIKTLSNWSLDERFAARYPELAPLVKISGMGEIGLQGPYVF
ncbi:Bip1 [Botrytis cinerea B05.10]|uniref:Bip1 n=1 Tax=Botryotinia fuckeliana (strain B05.10) TaxID=332648 RepID=A0A384JTB7_BOTFB|nr:Bip1 [Botrytis cinerea B05.10]ATZ53742.1 Bip1 [Botrytis cinerea B05.10]